MLYRDTSISVFHFLITKDMWSYTTRRNVLPSSLSKSTTITLDFFMILRLTAILHYVSRKSRFHILLRYSLLLGHCCTSQDVWTLVPIPGRNCRFDLRGGIVLPNTGSLQCVHFLCLPRHWIRRDLASQTHNAYTLDINTPATRSSSKGLAGSISCSQFQWRYIPWTDVIRWSIFHSGVA